MCVKFELVLLAVRSPWRQHQLSGPYVYHEGLGLYSNNHYSNIIWYLLVN